MAPGFASPDSMTAGTRRFDLIVVAASAGGVDALGTVFAGLPLCLVPVGAVAGGGSSWLPLPTPNTPVKTPTTPPMAEP